MATDGNGNRSDIPVYEEDVRLLMDILSCEHDPNLLYPQYQLTMKVI